MKNLGVFSKSILVICVGVSSILLSASVFMSSIAPAKADESFDPSPTTTLRDSGKYMIDVSRLYYNNAEHWSILVWDTETGKSKKYFFNSNEKKFQASGPGFQLPENPLE